MIVSTLKVAEQRLIKTALSYDLLIIIIRRRRRRIVAEKRYKNKVGMSSY